MSAAVRAVVMEAARAAFLARNFRRAAELFAAVQMEDRDDG